MSVSLDCVCNSVIEYRASYRCSRIVTFWSLLTGVLILTFRSLSAGVLIPDVHHCGHHWVDQPDLAPTVDLHRLLRLTAHWLSCEIVIFFIITVSEFLALSKGNFHIL